MHLWSPILIILAVSELIWLRLPTSRVPFHRACGNFKPLKIPGPECRAVTTVRWHEMLNALALISQKKQNSHELTRNPTGIVWGCLKPYCFPHHHFPPEIPRVKTQFNITQWQFNSQAVLQPQQHSQEAKVKRLSKSWVGSESKRRTMHLWMTERDTTTLVKWNLNNYNSQWTSAQSYQVCRAVIFSEQERATVGQ